MTVSIAPTQSQVLTVLRQFLLAVLPLADGDVILGQINRVPEPVGGDFVVYWPLRRPRITTNVDATLDSGAGSSTFTESSEFVVQLDVHGPNSAENAQIVSTLFRDAFAVDFFATLSNTVSPLLADEPRYVVFQNDQNQLEDRWIIEARMQVDATTTVTGQDFADSINTTLIDVDAVYPP